MLKAKVGGILPNSLVNGEGIRTVFFLTGCPHKCPECQNEHMWDIGSGLTIPIEELYIAIDNNMPLISGITISGGDPFVQTDITLALTKYAKEKNLSVWVYTGYTISELKDKNDDCINKILNTIDVLVDGRYLKDLREGALRYTGSSNQRIINMQGVGE